MLSSVPIRMAADKRGHLSPRMTSTTVILRKDELARSLINNSNFPPAEASVTLLQGASRPYLG
jgi:hypothetical protein